MIFRKINGVHISEHQGHKELSTSNQYVEFLNPDYVYIALVEQGTPCECLVKVGDHVLIGQVIAMKGGRFSSPIHASVSGEVISIDCKMWHSSGKMIPTIQIKNDFKEEKVDTIKLNDVSKLTKEEIVEIIKSCGIVGLGGSGFPTYVKYMPNQKMDIIIVNAVECEPYISDDYTLMHAQIDVIVRGIKYLMKITGAKKATVAIKKNKHSLIEKMKPILDEENDISLTLVKDEYPAGWEKYLVQHITNKTYNALPSEVGAVVNNVATIVAVCNAIEKNIPLVEKMITVSGKGIAEPKNVYVKIGTKLNTIIEKIGGYSKEADNAFFIAGGPMTGKSIPFDSMIVNRSLTSVIVMPKVMDETKYNCLGCGKCAENCPAHLSPIQIYRAVETKDNKTIKELKANKCMQCGLCSYICPSRLELTEATGKAKALLMKK